MSDFSLTLVEFLASFFPSRFYHYHLALFWIWAKKGDCSQFTITCASIAFRLKQASFKIIEKLARNLLIDDTMAVFFAELPYAPTKPSDSEITADLITVSWQPGGGPSVDSFTLYYRPKTSTEWIVKKGIQGRNSMTLNNLKPYTTYQFRVFAVNAVGTSKPSPVAEFTTSQKGLLSKHLLFLQYNETRVISCKSTDKEVSFEWSHHRISSTGSKVRTALHVFIIDSGSERVKLFTSCNFTVVSLNSSRDSTPKCPGQRTFRYFIRSNMAAASGTKRCHS